MHFRFSQSIYAIISGALGALVFFVLYGTLLHPSYVDWIISIGWDPFQHYIGWELFRNSPWSLPIGHISQLVYPAGISLTFTDSIPLFSIFFKLFSPLLPFPFQFHGIWFLCCFILQGCFGYALIKQYVEKPVYAVVGSLFFILSPIMLFRLGGHSALGAHWLVLWSLLLVLRREGSVRLWQWFALLCLTVLVHPYFLFMCGAIFAADIAQRIWVQKTVSLKKALVFSTGIVGSVLALSWVIGVFSAGGGGAPGFGVFSLDLNALINPYGWSTIIQNMNVREPNEGFAYLGLGVIVLLLLSVFEKIQELKKENIRKWFKNFWPLIVACTILTLVAISNIVSVWGRELVHIPLSKTLREDVFGVVRSSGRLFWPVYYLIVVGAFFIIKKTKVWLATTLLICAVLLQGYDMKDKLIELHKFYTEGVWENPLQDPFWDMAAESFDHISFVPKYAQGSYEAIAFFAAKHQITLNTGYVVRAAGLLNEDFMQHEQQQLKEGVVTDRTLYIFRTEEEAQEFTKNVDKKNFILVTIDGYILLTPQSLVIGN